MSLSSALLILLVGVLWGLNWPVVKLLMTELPTYMIRAIAFPVAAILLGAIAIFKRESLWPSRHEFAAVCITGAFLVFGFNMLTSLGQTLTEASKAAIVAYTMPVMTALLSAVFLKETINRRIVSALIAGMLGIAVLLTEDLNQILANPIGVFTMLCAAFCWALGNVTHKAHAWQLSTTARAAWFFMVSTILAWPVVLLLDEPASWKAPDAGTIGLMVFHILGPMVLCYQLWAVLLTRLSASVAAISVLTAPVVGVISSTILLKEDLTLYKAVALLLIITSIAITQIPRRYTG